MQEPCSIGTTRGLLASSHGPSCGLQSYQNGSTYGLLSIEISSFIHQLSASTSSGTANSFAWFSFIHIEALVETFIQGKAFQLPRKFDDSQPISSH
jgi:hypothetical protein